MFTRLLDAARSEPDAVSQLRPSPQRMRNLRHRTRQNDNIQTESCTDEQVREIVHELSEFLFDIFDANCLPAYQAIESLEKSYCKHFSSWEPDDEFTHVMHDAWTRFTLLFEKLIEDFLKNHSWSHQLVYSAAQRALEDESLIPAAEPNDPWKQNPREQAIEILEVLMAVQDINTWAAQMRDLFDRTSESTSDGGTSGQQKVELVQIMRK